MHERRQFFRRRTLLSGKIEFFGRSTFDCVIRNLSEQGARLRCDQHIVLPDVFNLLIEKSAERRVVRTVWRGETDVGVTFASNVLAFSPRQE
jgi:hypothetical protein